MLGAFTTAHVLLCALVALAGGTAVGYPAAGLFEGNPRARLLIAPAMGLGLFGVAGTLVFRLVPFAPIGIAGLALAIAVPAALFARNAAPLFDSEQSVPIGWIVAAAALAIVPALAIAPQWRDGGVALGAAVFDHGKAALIDEIVHNGVPVHNPFYREAGAANLLNYYYLYYLVAAAAARLVGASGWEADVAMTGVVGFCALAAMAWGAVLLGRRRAAAWWVLPIAAAGSIRVIFNLIFGIDLLHRLLANEHHFEGWLEQTTWTPQHAFAATLALLAVLGVAGILLREAGEGDRAQHGGGGSRSTILPRTTSRSQSMLSEAEAVAAPSTTLRAVPLPRASHKGGCVRPTTGRPGRVAAVVVGALIAASYDSSLWIGGIGLAAILPALAAAGLVFAPPSKRLAVLASLAVAATTAIALAADFIARNLSLVGKRPAVALWSYPTIAARLHAPLALNEIAYWLVWLLLDFGFAYVLSATWLGASVRGPRRPFEPVHAALALTILLPLLVAQHVHSIIANNDLGWRIVLPAAFAMTIVAAATASRLPEGRGRRWLVAGVATLLVPGLIAGIASAMVSARVGVSPGSQAFLDRQALWEAVRAVTPKDEAVLNNPADLAKMTLYPGNIGWALLAGRRSCAAGDEWLASMAPQLLPDAKAKLDALIARVFEGGGSDEDLRELGEAHLCRTLVVVPGDGLWAASKSLAANPHYVLADQKEGRWRIYRWRDQAPD